MHESLLGIISILIRVMPPSMHAFILSGWRNGSETQATICPLDNSEMSGNLIEMIISHSITTSRSAIVAPDSVYSLSE